MAELANGFSNIVYIDNPCTFHVLGYNTGNNALPLLPDWSSNGARLY